MPQLPSAAPSPMSFNLGRPAPSGIQRLFKEPLQFTPWHLLPAALKNSICQPRHATAPNFPFPH